MWILIILSLFNVCKTQTLRLCRLFILIFCCCFFLQRVRRRKLCMFREKYTEDKKHIMLQSYHNSSLYVGFSPKGTRLKGDKSKYTRKRFQKCFEFIKYQKEKTTKSNIKEKRRHERRHRWWCYNSVMYERFVSETPSHTGQCYIYKLLLQGFCYSDTLLWQGNWYKYMLQRQLLYGMLLRHATTAPTVRHATATGRHLV